MQLCTFLCKAAIIVCGVFLVCCHSSGMDLTTKSGTTYKNCSIHRGDKTGIYIRFGDSLKFIPLSDVPDDIAERYSANLKTKLGDIYYDYSVVRVRNDALKIKHKWGVSWVDKAVLPDFLLEKYGNVSEISTESSERSSARPKRKNAENESVQSAQNVPIFTGSQKVVVNGSGINEQTALEDAFRNAVRQVVGAYVITRSSLKENDFSEEIYVNADAVVSSHEILRKRMENGLVELTVQVVVVSNDFSKYIRKREGNKISPTDISNLLNKRNSLNLAQKSVPYIFGELMRNVCTIQKKGSFDLSSEDETRGENLIVKINYTVRFDDNVVTSGLERMMTLLDRTCTFSHVYRIANAADKFEVAEAQRNFSEKFRRNKTDGIVCFIDRGRNTWLKCYYVPHQFWRMIESCCSLNEEGTIFLLLKLTDGTCLRYAFRAEIGCWHKFRPWWADNGIITFYRNFSFNCYSDGWQHGIKAENNVLTVNLLQSAFRRLKDCEFEAHYGLHGRFLFARHLRHYYDMERLSRKYVPAMISMAEDFNRPYYYHRAALWGSSHAMNKLGWKNNGLGFAIRQGKIFSAEKTIKGLYEGIALEKINNRELSRLDEDDLSQFIGAIPSGTAVKLSIEGGREVTVIAK